MLAHHRPKRDEPDKRIRRDQAQAHDECVAQRLEIVIVQASIHHKEEDRRDLRGAGERVFDSRVLGKELRRQVRARDILVVRREGVS